MSYEHIEKQIEGLNGLAKGFEGYPLGCKQAKAYASAADTMRQMLEVVKAVSDIKWRSIEKDNMEFATTCFAKDKITRALAKLEASDE